MTLSFTEPDTFDYDTADTNVFVPKHELRDNPSQHKAKRFIGWDGEGVNNEDGSHAYILFGNSNHAYISNLGYDGLSTVDCFELLLAEKQRDPNTIHVAFSFGYDVEMMLKDVSRTAIKHLYQHNYCRWRRYRIEYIKNKWFTVSRGGTGIRVWDIFSFFTQSFVKAVKKYMPDTPDDAFATVAHGKGERGTWTRDDYDDLILPYWYSEIVLLAQLADTLRDRLYEAGIVINKWHGPGAVAAKLMQNHNMQQHMNRRTIPREVRRAAQYAYAGGRFELFKMGRYDGPVYEHDINSAYPYAISQLPPLNGKWHYGTGKPDRIAHFGVYHIRAKFPRQWMANTEAFPLFVRNRQHLINFPMIVDGWFWSPEANNVFHMSNVEFVEYWEMDDSGERPFSWVADMYQTRLKWKDPENYVPAEKALKVGLNSLYGKMAQRKGKDSDTKPPPWHQLEWAGWVTSFTRALMFQAAYYAHKKGTLISIETDAVFSTVPLDDCLDIGEGLGQWGQTKYDGIMYVQSGIHWTKSGDVWAAKFRGLDPESLTYDDVSRYFDALQPGTSPEPLKTTVTRFNGMGIGMISPDRWRKWETTPRLLSPGDSHKRRHFGERGCHACRENTPHELHDLSITYPMGIERMSYPHPLPWVDGNIKNTWREYADLEEWKFADANAA